MPRDSIVHTFKVTIILCVVCSVAVSLAAVGLRDLQNANRLEERNRNILLASGLLVEGEETDSDTIKGLYEAHIVPRVIRLESGVTVPEERVPPEASSLSKMLQSDNLSEPLSQSEDIAGIRRQEKYSVIYEVHDDPKGGVTGWVLPVRGYGLWSTLYGFLALDNDLSTIRGLTFYQHGETPGLGGEVDNPRWKDLWRDPDHPKQAFDEDGDIAIEVIKGAVDPQDPESSFKVDGLAGATITTRGISSLLQYWLGGSELSREVTIDGETRTKTTLSGFGPFLQRLRNSTAGKESVPRG